MRAVKLSNGKNVEAWKISRKEDQTGWVKQAFTTGELSWIDETALRVGYMSPMGLRAVLGDVLIFDGRELKILSAKNFEKHYQIF